MSISKIEIKNCKSIKNVTLDLKTINSLIGVNGSGKSTIMRVIRFFYESLTSEVDSTYLKDKKNSFSDDPEITLTYDLSHLFQEEELFWGSIFPVAGNWEPKKDLSSLKKLADKNKMLSIKLVLNNGSKKWSPNITYTQRNILKNLFPFYYISIRDLELTNWNDLWQMIGELGKLQDVEFSSELEEFFTEIYGDNYKNTLDILKNEFRRSDVNINKFSMSDKFSTVLQLQLGGNNFKFNYTDLDFFSDGMNSFNYLSVFGLMVAKISEIKLKSPLVILDEPEIGLHPKYIDKLMKQQIHKDVKPQLLISTHSPRVLKNLIKNSIDYNLFHITDKNSYAKVTNVQSNYSRRERTILNDQEASLYFSNKIAFVEGETELELFGNEYLNETFKFLEDVEFYSYKADDGFIGAAHPRKRNYNTPYLIITDIDQIYKIDDSDEKKIKVVNQKKYINPLNEVKFDVDHNKERYFYGRMKKIYFTRKRIELLLNFRYSYDKHYKFFHGSHYKELQRLTHSYCLFYNVYPVQTTIEGTLVNESNIKEFEDWLKIKFKNQVENIESLFKNGNSKVISTTIGRLLVNGKYENFKKIPKQGAAKKFPPVIAAKYETIFGLRRNFDKTSGWVTEWLDYFFENYILIEEEESIRIQIFKKYFPELYNLIYTLKNLK
jgi:predicted ATP-dependent endonuclease of OLD family